jgi:capsular polysaccharide biosynthesis protein
MSAKRTLKSAVAKARSVLLRQPVKPTGHWSELLACEGRAWDAARKAAKRGPRVLVATSTGGHSGVTPVEGMLAVALTLRGANVHFLLCDKFLPACLLCTYRGMDGDADFVANGPRRFCDGCYAAGDASYEPWELPIHRYSKLVTREELARAEQISQSVPVAEIGGYKLDGMAVGEHALAGALRFFARGDLDGEPNAGPVLRRYFKAALLTVFAVRRLIESEKFDAVVFHHGIYVPQGLVGESARRLCARVVNWAISYRKQCLIFSHGDTYHHTLMAEPVDRWENIELPPETESMLMDYLESRAYGTNDWIRFVKKPHFDLDALSRELGVDFSKPCIGLLSNVIWDAQLHYPANAFPNMVEWLMQTIAWFAKRPDLQLIIRVHPAESTGVVASRQRLVDEISRRFSDAPRNVFVIGPDNDVSTYAVMEQCDTVIIYGTKTGVELSARGMPVIVAGEAWIRNKGVTMDASDAAHYFKLLAQLPLRRKLDADTTARARRYAYHFFFRRMIPVDCIEQLHGKKSLFQINAKSLDDLRPGRSRGLDIICDGILKGSDFIYPAEEFASEEKNEPRIAQMAQMK